MTWIGSRLSMLRRRSPAACAFVLAIASASDVRAVDVGGVGGEPVHLDITDGTSVFYNVNNRNSRPGSVPTRVDDDWGVWYNRLNLQGSWKAWQVGLRLDSAWFYAAPDPTATAITLLRERRGGSSAAEYTPAEGAFFSNKVTEASGQLATRYTSWIYPSKYYIGYAARDVELTIGDFYAQLGRGLVLSVRKRDELASDTTVRGGRVTARLHVGEVRFRVTALGGAMNPLRIDEASGRYLGVTGAVTPGLLSISEGGMPRANASPFDDSAEPTYAPDRVVGAQIEGGTRVVQVGVQGSMIDRTLVDHGSGPSALSLDTPSRTARSLRTASVSASAPDLGGHGAAYLEVALQGLSNPPGQGSAPDAGQAAYASVSVNEKPVTITAEGKHYRRFFPLAANVDTKRVSEFSAVQYSAPPTTEGVWIDTEYESFNTCVTGGRLRTDVQVGRNAIVFAWASRYLTWAESIANAQCNTSADNLNRVWDFASGFEIVSKDRRNRATATAGSRFDDTARLITDPNGGETHVFYREIYGRYELTQWLGGPFSLKLQGWDRRRHQTFGVAKPWTELQQLITVDYAGRLSFGGGFEYTGNPQFPPTYFSGTFGYNFSSSSNVSLFAGQRRGGLRCVSGVCRVYPPFEGVRVDATFRF